MNGREGDSQKRYRSMTTLREQTWWKGRDLISVLVEDPQFSVLDLITCGFDC